MQPFALVFDMDGVIVDSNPYHKRSLLAFIRRYGYDLGEAELREKVFGRNNREWIPNVFSDRDLSDEVVRHYAEEKERLFREMYAEAVAPLPGLRTFLDRLQTLGVPYAIATSAPRANVDFTLDRTDLTRYFTTILHESHFDRGKPDPEIYRRAAAALRFDPARCLVFEDSLSGVEAARRAGCPVVGVTTTHPPEELTDTVLQIPDFEGLSVEGLAQYV
ncbi:MAG: HAD family phosphatase [Catalinimonas sp.]